MNQSALGRSAIGQMGAGKSAQRGRGHRLLGLALVAVFLLAACGSPQATAGLTHALPADFTISAYQGADVLGGDDVRLSELLAQGKPVVLNLWAGLCPPCRFEMPDFQAVSDAYSDEIVLVGVDIGPYVGLGSREDGRALLRELGITYPVGTTFDERVVRDYQVRGMPTTLFIKPDGEIIQTWTGALNATKLTELVNSLIESSEIL